MLMKLTTGVQFTKLFSTSKSRQHSKKISVQFHQQLKQKISSLIWQTFLETLFTICPILGTEKKHFILFSRKRRERMLKKSTSGVNFINILQAAIMCADPESTKKTVKLSVFFALSGSGQAKAAHRTLIKVLQKTHAKNIGEIDPVVFVRMKMVVKTMSNGQRGR